ncbi:CPBP family intramembrane glutamic endopeptidase [Eisenibacter elegans]|uniref:CPBP family intramembrane glutamic endopeptidase n=1 Tax=Eisenibacter elegans TaxID=997 RepID=UPI0003F98ACA|nr:CPBP family intramembrane glutamic endopeptidase [Eisenibacter elegans]
MSENTPQETLYSNSPEPKLHTPENNPVARWIQLVSHLLLLLGFVLVGLFVFQLVGLAALMPFFSLDFQGLADVMRDPMSVQPPSKGRVVLLVLQGMMASGGFIISTYAYLRWVEGNSLRVLSPRPSILAQALVLTVLVTLLVMPFNALLIEWNTHIQLPSVFSGWEQWAKSKEDQLRTLTEFMTSFASPWEFALGLLVIGVVPAIGEELVFRGVLQRRLSEVCNIHIAIWLSGMIFSAIHLQFYGFFPRMALGILFGYLFYWSGNLWLPILAHFVNNAFTVTMIYLHQQGSLGFDIEDTQAVPLSTALTSLAITAGLLFIFHRIHIRNHLSPHS